MTAGDAGVSNLAPRGSRLSLGGGSRSDVAQRAGFAVAIVLLAGVLVYGAASTPGFLTWDNVKAILASLGAVGIVAVGMTLIMLGGSLFSLSLGVTVAVGAMSFLSTVHLGLVPAIAITLALGGVICAIQGVAVGGFRANPIIVTIAAGALQQGIVSSLTGGSSVEPSASLSVYKVLITPIFGIPFSVYALAVVAILVQLALKKTAFGRRLYLIGENRKAAYAAGLPVTRVTTIAFGIAGVCAAAAGILVGSLNENASLQLSGTFTYDAISAAIVGGNAISGGRGSVARTVLGALVIATVSDLMLLRNYSSGVQIMVKGAIVLIFVALLNARRWRTER